MTNCLKRAGALLSFALVMLVGNPALAGTVRSSSHPGCDYEFRGQFAPGDARRVSSIRGGYDGVTLCLNSPGGSVAEGLAVFEEVRQRNIKTRVPAGWECLSTCALVFMAGSIETGVGVPQTFGARQLDPGGRLGFHAPGLVVQRGNFDPDHLAQAFSVAIGAAATLYRASLLEEGGWRSFNEFIYSRILETPFTDMYRVNTVASAALAEMDLGPTRLPNRIGPAQIANICDAAYLLGGPIGARLPEGPAAGAWRALRREGGANPDAWEARFRTTDIERSGNTIIGRVGGYEMRYTGMGPIGLGCEVRINVSVAGQQDYLYDSWSENGARVSFLNYSSDSMETPPRRWWRGADRARETVTLPYWMLHDPQTRLASLAPGSAGQASTGQQGSAAFRPTHRISTFQGGLVNMRAGPGTDHAVIRQVPHGTGLRILARGQDGWVRIRTANGDTGWVSGRLLARQ